MELQGVIASLRFAWEFADNRKVSCCIVLPGCNGLKEACGLSAMVESDITMNNKRQTNN